MEDDWWKPAPKVDDPVFEKAYAEWAAKQGPGDSLKDDPGPMSKETIERLRSLGRSRMGR